MSPGARRAGQRSPPQSDARRRDGDAPRNSTATSPADNNHCAPPCLTVASPRRRARWHSLATARRRRASTAPVRPCLTWTAPLLADTATALRVTSTLSPRATPTRPLRTLSTVCAVSGSTVAPFVMAARRLRPRRPNPTPASDPARSLRTKPVTRRRRSARAAREAAASDRATRDAAASNRAARGRRLPRSAPARPLCLRRAAPDDSRARSRGRARGRPRARRDTSRRQPARA